MNKYDNAAVWAILAILLWTISVVISDPRYQTSGARVNVSRCPCDLCFTSPTNHNYGR